MTAIHPATGKGEATRAFLIRVAAEVFAERGYAGTRLSDLINRSGLTKGAFYFHFRSKQALALAVVEHKQAQWLGRVEAQLAQCDSAVAAVHTLGATLLALHRDDPASWSVSRLSRELAREPEAAPLVRRDMRAWVKSVERLLRAAAHEQDRVLPADPSALAALLVAGFDGLKELSGVLDGDGPDAFDAFTPRVEALQAVVSSWFAPA